MKRRRYLAFLLSILIFCATPVADYLYVRDTYALSLPMTAMEYVFDVLFHIVGVKAGDNTRSLIGDIEKWIDSGIETRNKYLKVFGVISKIGWDMKVELGQQAIDMVRDYFRSKGGYGSETGLDNVVVGSSSMDHYRTLDEAYLRTFNGVDNWEDIIPQLGGFTRYICSYETNELYVDVFTSVYYDRIAGYIENKEDGSTRLKFYSSDTFDYDGATFFHVRMNKNTNEIIINNDILPSSIELYTIPIPFFSTRGQARYYGFGDTDSLVGCINGYTDGVTYPSVGETVPVESLPDIQNRSIGVFSPWTIPATPEAALTNIESLDSAVTADEMAAALAGVGAEVTYGDPDTPGEGEDDKPFLPWLPDITGLFEGVNAKIDSIGQVITDIKTFITDIPQKLTDIYNFIISIPELWTDFWTIDYDAVMAALAGLEEAFQSKLSPVMAIADIFANAHASMNNKIPIITMKVPPDLAPYTGGEEIVVFDLRGYESYVSKIRLLFQCSMWVSFAIWLINSIKFHFGID